MNKRGIIKIVEAFVAVLIVAGVLLFIVSKQVNLPEEKASRINNLELSVLREISLNNQFRNEILNGEISQQLNDTVKSQIPEDKFVTVLKICGLGELCPLENFPEGGADIYSNSIAITSNITNYQPRQLKIFVWEK